jgi:S1-C subfamily serine protease
MSADGPGDDGAPEPDDTPTGPPPDPHDRPWVHPSELHSFTSAPVLPERETRPREWVIGLGSAAAAVVATILVLVAFGALGGRHRAALPPPVVTTPNDVIDYSVAEQVGSAVAASVVAVRVGGDGGHTVGSGVAIGSDRIMTAAHLLNGASEVSVVTTGGDQLAARVVGADAQTDLALLAVSGGDLQLAPMARSTPPKIGQPIVAVSADRGGHYSVSIDVVSDRDAMVDTGTGVDVAGLLETGLTVQPSMAGGALVDAGGNLVGVLTRATDGMPDGLAIPIASVRDVQEQLDGSGKVTHGWMGVVCDGTPADLADGDSGARIQGVVDGGPAAAAGLQNGDVIVRAGGRLLDGRPDLVATVRAMRPLDHLDVQYVRDGRTRTTTVTLGVGDPQLLMAWPTMG